MDSRLYLQEELEKFLEPVYFQPPSNVRMIYPCIVYSKNTNHTLRADNGIYGLFDAYRVTVIERDPDSKLTNDILQSFSRASLGSRYVVDNLYHSIINLYF